MFRKALLPFFALLPQSLSAQDFAASNLSLSENASDTILAIIATGTFLAAAPAILIMVTCFPFFVTVFAIMRQGIGLQQSPPNMLLIGLALFMTFFVMEPIFLQAWNDGIQPVRAGTLSFEEGFTRASEPFVSFMQKRTDPDTLYAMEQARAIGEQSENTTLTTIIPAFVISEISHAFQVGFLIYLPFLIIDLVVSAVLMSMGMMMVPPAVVSLPFKLGFFVLSDGWSLITLRLIESYGT
ncbi:MAG: flagellar type III secretion system pore protein FliP [Pseudomonadota bacterium]|nr:flagellar type III secretion system pore protein FliP [Pseudomonadota bacterium]